MRTQIAILAVLAGLSSGPLLSQSPSEIQEKQDYVFARGLFQDGHYELALHELDAFQRKHPRSNLRPDVLFLAAECQFKLNQNPGAIKKLEELLRNYPTSPLRDEAMLRLGDLAFAEKRYEDAVKKFSMVLKENPDDPIAGDAAYWLGESYYRLGDHAKALSNYSVCVTQYPTSRLSDYAAYSIGWVHQELKQYSKSRDAYNDMIAKYPKSSLASAARVRIGESYVREKKYEKAIEYLKASREAMTNRDDQAEADYLIAECYFDMGDTHRALGQYQRFLSSHPGHRLEGEVRYSIGWTYLHERNYSKAIGAFNELVDGSDDLSQAALFRRGVAERLGGQRETAVSTFESTIQHWPDGAYADNAMYELGGVAFDAGDYDKSRRILADLTRDYKNSDVLADALLMMGEACVRLDDLDRALESFRSATTVKGGSPAVVGSAMMQEGWVLAKQKKYEEAITRLSRFLTANPGHERLGDAHFWLGECNYQLDRLKPALKHYDEVLMRFPKNSHYVDAVYGSGWARYRLKDYAGAAKSFEKLSRMEPQTKYSFDAYVRLGDSHFALKDYSRAVTAYRNALKLFPQAEGRDYVQYQIGQCNARAGAVDKAIEGYTALFWDFPTSPLIDDGQYAIGWLHFQQKQFDKAIHAFRALIDTYPKSELVPRAHYSIGDCYYNKEEYSQAIESYGEVVRRFPSSTYAVEALSGIQYCYSLMGKDEEGLRALDKYLSDNPGSPMTDRLLLKKAEILYNREDYVKAIASYDIIVHQHASSSSAAEAYYWKGKSHLALKHLDEGIEALDAVAVKYPASPIAPLALLDLARLYASQERYDEALNSLERITRDYGTTEFALQAEYEKGMAYLNSDRLDMARDQFSKVADENKGTMEGDRCRIGLGLVQERSGDLAGAIAQFKDVASRRTDDLGAEAQVKTGNALHAMGKTDEAIIALLRVRYVYPSSSDWIARSYLKLGELYERNDQNAKAREAYEMVLKSHKDDQFAREAGKRMKEIR